MEVRMVIRFGFLVEMAFPPFCAFFSFPSIGFTHLQLIEQTGNLEGKVLQKPTLSDWAF